MSEKIRLTVVSDIHYASAAEQGRGDDFETREIRNPMFRAAVRLHRHYIWCRYPLRQNHLLENFFTQCGSPDYVVANGDFSCDTSAVGVSDEASFQSAKDCLDKLRRQFPNRLMTVFGDHELGKVSLVGGRGGMRLASWKRSVKELGLQPFWKLQIGNYVLIGVVSSLVGLPVFAADTLPAELPEWEHLREEHLREVCKTFQELKPQARVLLFCHDPTALPFLAREEAVRSKFGQIEHTVIGHLHSNLILRQSRLLAGMPQLGFLGHTAKRLSTALREARHWKPFQVLLCPSLSGLELLKDGGYLSVEIDVTAQSKAQFRLHRLKRDKVAETA